MGIPAASDTTLYTLCFADDQIVAAQDAEDLEYMSRKLIDEYEKWGLHVNIRKTGNMVVGGDQNELIMEGEQRIKGCTEYKYILVYQ